MNNRQGSKSKGRIKEDRKKRWMSNITKKGVTGMKQK